MKSGKTLWEIEGLIIYRLPQMKKAAIQIDVWSDVVCPFCNIGHQQLNKALALLPEEVSYQIEWKGYLLNPQFNRKHGENLIEHLSRTKGQTIQWAQEATAHVESFAAREGLTFYWDIAIPADSKLAHLLLQLAKAYGKSHHIYARLFKAYFEEGLAIDQEKVLQKIATDFELDWIEVKSQKEILENKLANDIQEARILGVQGVPFMVINKKWGISGARGSQVISNAMLQAYQEMS